MRQKTKILTAVFAVLLVFCVITACFTPKFTDSLKFSSTDYAVKEHWLRFENKGRDADVFMVYPTVTFSSESADRPFIGLDSPLMRQEAEKWLTKMYEIVSDAGNIYVPLYRQLNGAMLESLDSAGFEKYTLSTPRDDVFAAFGYFLKNINKNERPFILIGHSQGAALVAEIATLLLGHPAYSDYNKNHIATYAVGYSVTQEKIGRNPKLEFSKQKDDIGVILSWNTTSKKEVESKAYEHFGTWNPEALTTNPINWKKTEKYAPATENLSSKLYAEDGSYTMVKDYADAKADNTHKVLVASTVPEDEYKSVVSSVGKFHNQDMLFYYYSIKKNIEDRIKAFKEVQ